MRGWSPVVPSQANPTKRDVARLSELRAAQRRDGSAAHSADRAQGNGQYEDGRASVPSGEVGSAPQQYRPTVPDWVYGSPALAALALPHRNHSDGTQGTRSTGIVPLAQLGPGDRRGGV